MARERSRRHLQRRLPAPPRQHEHYRSHRCPVKPLAESVRGATDRIATPASVWTTSSFCTKGTCVACLLDTSLTTIGRELISPSRRTRPRHDASMSRRKVASWRRRSRWPAPSVRAPRRLTRRVAYQIAATVSDTRRLRPRVNRSHPPQLVSASEFLTSPALGGGPPSPSRRRILFGEGQLQSHGPRRRFWSRRTGNRRL
jgi:hypothetical protein